MKKLVLETTAPFQGLPELVAYDEGLFEQEGLIVEWADREKDVEKKTEINVISPKGLDPFSSHGKLLEQGQADMYNACEWGNYCRVQDTRTGSRQLGRRGIGAVAQVGGEAALLHPALLPAIAGLIRSQVGDGQRRDIPGPPRAHGLDALPVHEVAVLDAVRAQADGGLDGLGARSMRHHAIAALGADAESRLELVVEQE